MLKENVITIFGDSISKGLCLDNGEIKNLSINYVDLLRKDFVCNIINNSYFGQTFDRATKKNVFTNYLKTAKKGDVVIINLGGNDADFNWAEVAKHPDYEHTSKTVIEDFKQEFEEVIKQFLKQGIKVIVTSLFPIDAERYFNNVVSKKNESSNVLQFLKNDVTNLSRHQEAFNLELAKICCKNDCCFVDYRSALLQKTDFLKYLCQDGIHPSEIGQQFIYKSIKEALNKI